ncbi:hypothetical protein ACIBL6_17975 [Streptomyces sp. NPDC050400]|uniref:hypothetical protein n=1 Tax=Streptomyces sp. NPDC050400 TaxID=3365610 RepID=UPI003795B6AC
MTEPSAGGPHRTSNQVSGDAQFHGPVVQAGCVNGDINIHPAPSSPEVPLLVSVEDRRRSNDIVELADGTLLGLGAGVRVTVEGLTQQAVILKELRPVVLSRTPPRPPVDRGFTHGKLEVRGFEANLDRTPPSLVPLPPEPQCARTPNPPSGLPLDFPFKVSSSDPEVFEVYPCSQSDVTWRLELDWSSAGRSGTVTITGPEGPFRYWADPPMAPELKG